MIVLPERTNVLFLTIDALRADRLGIGGYRPSVSPNLDRIFGSGLTTTNLINGGGMVTQFAFPSLFSSTFTLDHGGYDFGIRDRPDSFVESLSSNGYETVAFCPTGTLSRHYGYARGFNRYHHLTDLTDYVYIFFTRYVQYHIEAIRSGQLSTEAYLPELARELRLFYAFGRSYCAEKLEEMQCNLVPRSPLIHRWNFEELAGLFEAELERVRGNPTKYALDLLRAPRSGNLLNDIVSRINTVPRYPSTAYLLDAAAHWIKTRRDRRRPFMAWVHVLDVHEKRFSSFDRIVHEHEMTRETAAIMSAQQKIHQAGEAYRGDAQYDYSVAYVDHRIGEVWSWLNDNNILDDTLVVVTSDHGLRGSGHPFRTKEEADVADFVDDYVRVPLTFVHPDIQANVTDTLCSSIDVAPTILSLLGLEAPASFRGDAGVILRGRSRPFTLSENLGRGLCRFDAKPVRVAVRTRTHKLVLSQPLNGSREDAALLSFHDLANDPDEKRNLLDEGVDEDVRQIVELLQNRGLDRIDELRAARLEAPDTPLGAPRVPDARRRLENGESALVDGNCEQALEIFERVLADEPEHTGALNDAGLACLQLNRRGDALRFFARAVDADPSFEIAFFNLLDVLIDGDDLLRAAAVFEQLDASIPETPEKRSYRLALYERSEKQTTAKPA